MYRPIAARGSSMYFLIRDMAAVNNMYAFALAIFLQIFRKALSKVRVRPARCMRADMNGSLMPPYTPLTRTPHLLPPLPGWMP